MAQALAQKCSTWHQISGLQHRKQWRDPLGHAGVSQACLRHRPAIVHGAVKDRMQFSSSTALSRVDVQCARVDDARHVLFAGVPLVALQRARHFVRAHLVPPRFLSQARDKCADENDGKASAADRRYRDDGAPAPREASAR